MLARVSQLRTDIYVRMELDDDYIKTLASVIQGGRPLAVTVTRDHRVVDGRTTLEAYRSLGYEEVPVTYYDGPTDTKTLILEAVRRNGTGPRPLNEGDVRRVVKQLIAAKVTHQSILVALAPIYTARLIRKAIAWLVSNDTQKRLREGRRLMASGDGEMTVNAAARAVGVTAADLKEFIAGKDKEPEFTVMQLEKKIAFANRSHGEQVKDVCRKIVAATEAGDLTQAEGHVLLKKVEAYSSTLRQSADRRISRYLQSTSKAA